MKERYSLPDRRPAPNPASPTVLAVLAVLAVLCAGVLLLVPIDPAQQSVAWVDAVPAPFAVTGEVDQSDAGVPAQIGDRESLARTAAAR